MRLAPGIRPPSVYISRQGRILLNSRLYAILGCPNRVNLSYDDEALVMVFDPDGAFVVTRLSSNRGAISAVAATKDLRLKTGRQSIRVEIRSRTVRITR